MYIYFTQVENNKYIHMFHKDNVIDTKTPYIGKKIFSL